VTNGIEQHDWDFLLRRINNGECVAILGPEIGQGLIDSQRDLAAQWIKQHDCPLADTSTLAQVAQYLAFRKFELFPKDEMQKYLQGLAAPDFGHENQAHAILAKLKLPLYITTNYDDFLFGAISHQKQLPTRELYRWNDLLTGRKSALSADYKATPATPLVFHLHGHVGQPESMVLTEDDYLTFLLNIRSETYPVPAVVKQAISESSLLILGYHPADWDFRVLIRGLIQTTDPRLRRLSVTVQFPQGDDELSQQALENYINTYLRQIDNNMRVYWGTSQAFLTELQQRMTGKDAETAETPPGPTINVVHVFQLMHQSFSIEELKNLAFMMTIDHEDLPSAKKSFARELIRTAQNQRRLAELLDYCRQERPQAAW
jgi:hypothetical protein